jgi:acetyl-CoA C-acetyltransferase
VAEAYIVGAVRTPVGTKKGALAAVHPADLGAHVLKELVERTGVDPSAVEDVIMGCVSQVGPQALDLARTSWLSAGLPEGVPGVTIDRQCGSSQQAVHFAAQGVMAGAYDVAIACGVESMSRVPMGSSMAGQNPFGTKIFERYPDGLVPQGISADLIATIEETVGVLPEVRVFGVREQMWARVWREIDTAAVAHRKRGQT